MFLIDIEKDKLRIHKKMHIKRLSYHVIDHYYCIFIFYKRVFLTLKNENEKIRNKNNAFAGKSRRTKFNISFWHG